MRNRGFTLVEVLVAMVVLGVGLLAIAKMSLVYTRSNVAAHTMSEAVVLAQEKMEQLRAYATSERADNFSVFDFNYLTSTEPCFTTIADPPPTYPGTTVKMVSGLLSGGVAGTGSCTVTGAPLVTTMGTTYEVLYDTGATLVTTPDYGDDAAGDGVWTGADRIFLDTVSAGGTGFFVTRRWMVEPMVSNPGVTTPTYARLAVESYWTDQFGAEHDVRIESLVFMRQ